MAEQVNQPEARQSCFRIASGDKESTGDIGNDRYFLGAIAVNQTGLNLFSRSPEFVWLDECLDANASHPTDGTREVVGLHCQLPKFRRH